MIGTSKKPEVDLGDNEGLSMKSYSAHVIGDGRIGLLQLISCPQTDLQICAGLL